MPHEGRVAIAHQLKLQLADNTWARIMNSRTRSMKKAVSEALDVVDQYMYTQR